MRTKLLRVDASNPDRRVIAKAASVIRNGGIVVFPTETVYGIGADAYNRKAVERIYKIKSRPKDNPAMIHVSDMKMAMQIGNFPRKYVNTVEKLWPGPIAFVVNARKGLQRKEVSMRMPEHKVALALIKESGTPIAAPSANTSKRPSSTTASHALAYFDGKVDVVIDSGPSDKGIESTILDLRSFTIQRPGSFPVEEIAKAFGRKPRITSVARGLTVAKHAVAPGTKYKHYAPATPLFLYTGNADSLVRILGNVSDFAFIGSKETCNAIKGKGRTVMALGSRKDIDGIARNLFDALIRLDLTKARFAIAESFPESGMGLGLMNRLRKASSHRYFSSKAGFYRLYKSINNGKGN